MKMHPWVRLIALFKILKGLLMVGISFGIFRLIHANLESVAAKFLSAIRVDPENHYIRFALSKFTNLSPATIQRYGIVALIYSALLLTEGFGLWWEKKWAEYLVIVASSLFLPFELSRIWRHATGLNMAVFCLNVLIVIYLCQFVLRNRHRKS